MFGVRSPETTGGTGERGGCGTTADRHNTQPDESRNDKTVRAGGSTSNGGGDGLALRFEASQTSLAGVAQDETEAESRLRMLGRGRNLVCENGSGS